MAKPRILIVETDPRNRENLRVRGPYVIDAIRGCDAFAVVALDPLKEKHRDMIFPAVASESFILTLEEFLAQGLGQLGARCWKRARFQGRTR